jgi:alpha-mannosidase
VYLDQLSRLLTREIGTVELSGFTTLEHLHPGEALKRAFRPMPEGARWGRKWEYGWFKATVTLPP